MPMLVQYKIVDGFNEYYDYVIHQDDVDETDDENLINALIGEDRDEGDYRDIEVVYTKSIGIKHAEFLQECFIAFPYGGGEWLRQLATKKRSE
tara:strand:+ start:144 stop:422 length:279 start_codon:yes stop_codon:yes gene_type:complete